MSAVRMVSVTEDEADLRLDRWFRQHFPDVSHGRLEKLLRTGQVRVDGRRAKAGVRLAPGQVVRVPPLPVPQGPARETDAAEPKRLRPEDLEALRACVIYRDDWVVALNKPPGLAVQGGSGQTRHLDGLLEALRYEAAEAPRLVHRLDKDTSGVLLLGRTRQAAKRLSAAFRARQARKLYWAVVAGVPSRRQGTVDLALVKAGAAGRQKMRPLDETQDEAEGQTAVTRYRVIETLGETAAWLALSPLTGRTHQIRAHCAALGTPILGDGKYGGNQAFAAGPELSKRLHLHARAIALPHPSGMGTLDLEAPLPPHMAATWDYLGFDSADGDAAGRVLFDDRLEADGNPAGRVQ